MQSSVPIRHAVAGDLSDLIELYRHLHPDEPPAAPDAVEAAWRAMLGSGFVRVLVAASEDQLVASCTLAIIPNLTRGARPFGVIENVVTHAGYRDRGFGKAVLRAALAAAWDARCYKVMLATGSKRAETLGFYEAAGFSCGKTAFEVRRPED